MKADGILFDKDGTLLDFDAFWGEISLRAVDAILEDLGRTDIPAIRILEAFGIHNGVTSIEGTVCKGTYPQMGTIVYEILRAYGCEISREEAIQRTVDAYTRFTYVGKLRPASADLLQTLTQLKEMGMKLGVVTTDTGLITGECLQALGIAHLFDRIYTGDCGLPTKPDPRCAEDFCAAVGVDKDRLVMVGDTLTDMQFAKNAGIRGIGFAPDSENQKILQPHAHSVITQMSQLLDLLA